MGSAYFKLARVDCGQVIEHWSLGAEHGAVHGCIVTQKVLVLEWTYLQRGVSVTHTHTHTHTHTQLQTSEHGLIWW